MSRSFLLIVRAISLSLILAALCKAQNQKSPGILLFEKGDFAGAIELLKKSNDLVDLSYLGFAYEKSGMTKDARNAFDRSFRSGFKEFAQGIIEHSNLLSKQPIPNAKLSEYLQANGARLGVTAFSAQRTLDLKGSSSNDEWTIKARLMAEIGRILVSNRLIYSGREVDKDATITAKPRPGYTDEGRQNNEQGTVLLLVLLDVDGKVKAALPVEELRFGLTEQAYLAAFKISFTPAQKSAKPVAVLRAMTYSFAIY